jgi:hypothetical protein
MKQALVRYERVQHSKTVGKSHSPQLPLTHAQRRPQERRHIGEARRISGPRSLAARGRGHGPGRRARRSSAARSVQFNRSCEPGQPSRLPLTPSSISPGAFICLVAAGDGEGHRPSSGRHRAFAAMNPGLIVSPYP